MSLSGLGTHISADYGRIREAVSLVVSVSDKHISKHGSPSNNEVKLVFRSKVSRRQSVVGLVGKEGGSDAQDVVRAKLELKSLSILSRLVNTEMTNAVRTVGVICIHLGVKVSEQEQVSCRRDFCHFGLLLERIFIFGCGAECKGIETEKEQWW